MHYFFVYSVNYIKCDFQKLKRRCPDDTFVLIASDYCLGRLSEENLKVFAKVHVISRDFHHIDQDEVEQILRPYVDQSGANQIRLLTNEDSTQIGCARLRALFGIPGCDEDYVLPFVNKVVSKQRLGNAVRAPDFVSFDKAAFAAQPTRYLEAIEHELDYPMFGKPVDLVSSIEARQINNYQELSDFAESASKSRYEFEIDEYIDGDLYHGDAMVIDGQVKFFMVCKTSFPLVRFLEGKPIGSIPTDNPDYFNRLRAMFDTVIKKLNGQNGAFHLEAFLEYKSQQFVFLEIGARTCGSLVNRMYEKMFAMNMEETHYLIQMERIRQVQTIRPRLFVGFLTFPVIKGRVTAINRPRLEIANEFSQFVAVDDQLDHAANLLDASCSVMFWDESFSNVVDAFERVKHSKPLITYQNEEAIYHAERV